MTRAIRAGHIGLSFHDASTREVDRLLVAHRHSIERTAAPHDELL